MPLGIDGLAVERPIRVGDGLPEPRRAPGSRVLVEVTVGVPEPGSVDVERVRKELPHGEVTVRAVPGGLRAPTGDALLACVIITVRAEYPEAQK